MNTKILWLCLIFCSVSLFSCIDTMLPKVLDYKATIRGLRTSVECLREYINSFGELPEDEDALHTFFVQSYLPTLDENVRRYYARAEGEFPLDFYQRKGSRVLPLKYRRVCDNVAFVYSVGPDRIDDEGSEEVRMENPVDTKVRGDIVARIEITDGRLHYGITGEGSGVMDLSFDKDDCE